MGDQKKEPYFLIEGRGLVRLVALVAAVVAAIPVLNRASDAWRYGFDHLFSGGWNEAIMVVGMLIIMIVAGSVSLKGKFSIP
ncbi:MAG TPA: hypothetical protein VK661_10810 [Planctomycetota bacterium]|jgi:hypothetical protein|nr:hypothetical protein [Planctomycetota bacterium]